MERTGATKRRLHDETMKDRLYFYDAAGDLIVDAEREASRSSEIKPGKSGEGEDNTDGKQARQSHAPEQLEFRAA